MFDCMGAMLMNKCNAITLIPAALTAEAFAPYGDVVSGEGAASELMNGRAYERHLDLANIDIGSGSAHRVQLGLVECNEPEVYPYCLKAMERHPESSQLFYPLFDHDYLVAVAPASNSAEINNIDPSSIELFLASSKQGINYRRGVWHMPMLGIAKGDRFLMVERNDMHLNCEIYTFPTYQLIIELPLSITAAVSPVLLGGYE